MALEATVGVAVVLDLLPELPQWTFPTGTPTGIPPGLEYVTAYQVARLEGTPTEPGEFPVVVNHADDDGYPGTTTVTVTVAPGSGGGGDDDGPGTASATIVEGELVELELADVLGIDRELVDASVDPVPAGLSHVGGGKLVGRPTEVGELTVELSDFGELVGTVELLVLPAGSQATDDPWAVWDDLAASLAPRVAAMVGLHGDEDTIETAKAQLPIVAEYVRGYTRGRGFVKSSPAGPLLAVIVSATARLATNPEQLTVFTTGDYSERPARLAGWTLAEIGVLHRYRVISA